MDPADVEAYGKSVTSVDRPVPAVEPEASRAGAAVARSLRAATGVGLALSTLR